MPSNKSRKVVHVQFEPELLDKVDAMAKQQARTRSNQIRWLVLRQLERENRPLSDEREAASA